MVDKLIFAFEKFFAMVTSQRTVGTLVGLILIIVIVQGAIAAVVGGDPVSFDEEAVAESVGEYLALTGTIITAIIAVLQMTKNLTSGIQDRPPSLRREDYEKKA